MNQQNLADFIWNVADLLRGPFRSSLYMREAVRQQRLALQGSTVGPDLLLPAGAPFYNTSPFSLATPGTTSTRANLEDYIARFSANARQIDAAPKAVEADIAALLVEVAR